MNAMDVFQKEAPEVAKAFEELIQSLSSTTGLDNKTKQLIYIALKASEGDQTALQFHVPMAKTLGATKEEVRDAILLTLTISGITGIATCLPEAMYFYK